MLGVRQVRDLTVGITAIRAFDGISNNLVTMEIFWRHSVLCAVAAGQIAGRRGAGRAESPFVAGLLHDIGQLVLFGLLIIARRYRRFQGEVFALWLMAYALLRTTVETFRGDLERGTLHGLLESLGLNDLAARVPLEAFYNLSTSQFISLGMFAAGATLMVQGRRGLQPLPPLPLGVPQAA